MKNRIFSVFVLLTFVLNLSGFVVAKKVENANSGYELAKLLPESDAIVLLDSGKLIKEAIPQVLSANQTLLSKIMGKINNLKADTGLDLRNFKDVAIGLKNKVGTGDEIDFDPVVLARGLVDSTSIIAIARLASDGKYHTEKIGKRTVYIFSPDKIIEANKPKSGAKKDDRSIIESTLDKIFKGVSKEMAITAYDENTIAIGSLARVKEAIGTSARINPNILAMVNGTPDAVGKFGAILPNGLSTYVALDDDELSTTLNSIRKLHGSFDVNDGNATLLVSAETLETKDAVDLEATLIGFQMLGKILLGKAKGADKQVYSRMIENAKISRKEKLIMFALKVPKSDIDVIVGKK